MNPNQRIGELERDTNALFKTVFERLDDLDERIIIRQVLRAA